MTVSSDAPRMLRASIIIPAHNAGATLADCLSALNMQTIARTEYEIIVVDDGSQDQTAAVAQAGGADRVLVLTHRGRAAARNAGLPTARAPVILLTDADCEPATDWLAEMLRPLTELDVAGVKGSYRSRQREVVARLAQCEFEERYERLERTATVDFVDTHSAAFRAEVLREAGGFDPAFPHHASNEDVDLSYRLARAGCRLVFNRRAVVYHHHVSTWGAYLRLKAGRGRWRMVVYRFHPAKAVRDSYTPQLLKAQVALVYLAVVLAVLSAFLPPAIWAVGACLAAFALSAIPFTRFVARRDLRLARWAPLFVWLRAVAFAVGVAAGIASMPFFHRRLPVAPTRGRQA